MTSMPAPALASPSNPRIRSVARLRDRRERDATGLTLVDGAREVRRALESGVDVVEAFVCEPLLAGEDARAALDALRCYARSPRRPTTEAAFAKIAFGDRAEGLVAVVRAPTRRLDDLTLPDEPLLIVVEGVEKPGNVGAVLRSADGAGADAVVAASPRTDLFNPNAIRASAGTIFAVPIAAAPTAEVLGWLRERRRPDRRRPRPGRSAVHRRRPHRPVALVLGSEADGLTAALGRGGHRGGPTADARRRRQPERVGHRGGAAVRGAPPTRPSSAAARLTPWTRASTSSSSAPARPARRPPTRPGSSARPSRSSTGAGSAASCPHIGCLPSKSLLHGAAEHHANPTRYQWPRASAHRDYMINRASDAAEPDDSGHVERSRRPAPSSTAATGRITDRGRVEVPHDGVRHELTGTTVVVAVGSTRKRTADRRASTDIDVWTNEQATLARELPRSLLVLGGGPTGCELAQVYARFGVPTTIVQSGPRLAPTDHPRNSEAIRAALEARRRRRPDRRPGHARAGGRRRRTVRTSSTSTTARRVEGHAAAGSRSGATSRSTTSGSSTTASTRAVGRRLTRATVGCAIADGLYVSRRPGRPGAAHAPGPLPGRARRRGWRSART